MKNLFCIFFVSSFVIHIHAQTIRGHVYGSANKEHPLKNVKLVTSSGNTAYTNADGAYTINMNKENDTLFVFHEDKEMIRFPVNYVTATDKFDIYLDNPNFADSSVAHELPEVKLHARNYHEDSLQTREKYNDIFTYEKPKFRYGKEWILTPLGGAVNIDALIRLAQINRTKQKWRNKQFALQSEEELYVNSRFTRSLVGSITHLDDDKELAVFMNYAKPTAMQLRIMNDLALNQFIVDQFKEYTKCKVSRN
ncbi:hypothetical protein A9P82_08585 [Arachidicoccus ginsenosidimutans]|uniref:hypothetical protein n=1 Tax=Arachidicoccus sp. BS20 TaxID=1850526 RepID=UPI0007F17C7C|nr:hypothetical protein [Arachidicoccus sp. BS20]ANI89344.1 hypothetical protein A9P82_08585 [Arachidicoccus sp. BS20]